MRSPTELRDSLAALAEPVTPTEGYEARIRRRAGRIRARRRLAGAAAAVVGLAMVVALSGVGSAPRLTATPPDGPFLGWPAAGRVDLDLVREATAAWDRDGSHTAVRPLVATGDQLLHAVVVLQGYDRRGAPRLAFFTSDTTAGDALRLRADRPAPDPVTTRVISLISSRLTGPAGQPGQAFWDTYAVVLAMPGIGMLRVSTTTVDDEMRGDPDAATGRFVVEAAPSATAETTTITGFATSARPFARWREVFAVPGDGGADGDARGVRGTVVRRGDQRIVVAFAPDPAVRPGQLAVVAEGLVGRVTAVSPSGGEATIDLVTGAGFTSPAYSAISMVPGAARGDGGKLVMERIPAGDKMEIYEGNRILVPDPAQRGDEIGAVTLGRASATKPPGSDTVEVTPTAGLAHLRQVSIMTPFDGTLD